MKDTQEILENVVGEVFAGEPFDKVRKLLCKDFTGSIEGQTLSVKEGKAFMEYIKKQYSVSRDKCRISVEEEIHLTPSVIQSMGTLEIHWGDGTTKSFSFVASCIKRQDKMKIKSLFFYAKKASVFQTDGDDWGRAAYQNILQKECWACVWLNLTKNTVENYEVKREIENLCLSDNTAEDFLTLVKETATQDLDYKRTSSLLDRQQLLSLFSQGEREVCFYQTIKYGHDNFLIQFYLWLAQNDSGEVTAIVYCIDRTKEETVNQIVNTLSRTEFDFIIVINRDSGMAKCRSKQQPNEKIQSSSDPFLFEKAMETGIGQYVDTSDRKRCLKSTKIQQVCDALEKEEIYSVYFKTKAVRGEQKKKQLRFSYMSREKNTLLMTCTDVTTIAEYQLQQESELRCMVKKKNDANQHLIEYLTDISYQVRTPINAIMGLSEISRTNMEDEALLRDCIEKMGASAKYLEMLFDEVLKISEVEAGKFQLKYERIDGEQMFENIREMLSSLMKERGVACIYRIDAFLGHSYVGDMPRVEQMIVSLLHRAINATAQGGKIRLSAKEIQRSNGRATVQFKVADMGREGDVFSSSRAESYELVRKKEENELRVSVAKRLAVLMGGNIKCEHNKKQGTTFTVTVQLKTYDEEEKQSIVQEHRLAGKRILLMEDHPLNAMIMVRILEDKGCIVESAVNGQEGLHMFLASPENYYQAIIMDIQMPVMDGLEAAEKIRGARHPQSNSIPLIAITANIFAVDVNKSMEAGMNAHLSKPISAAKLISTLDSFI